MDGQLTIGQAIKILEKYDPNTKVKYGWGLGSSHSYRGYYTDLGLEPEYNVTVNEMLQELKFSLGRTYNGWKGGEFIMNRDTVIWLAEQGLTNDGGEITESIITKMISGDFFN